MSDKINTTLEEYLRDLEAGVQRWIGLTIAWWRSRRRGSSSDHNPHGSDHTLHHSRSSRLASAE